MSVTTELGEILRTNRRKFVKGLTDTKDVVDILREFGILTKDQCDRIFAEECPDDQHRKLIDIIPTREDPEGAFYYALTETNQTELADIVRADLQHKRLKEVERETLMKQNIGPEVPSDDFYQYQPDILPAEWPDTNPDHRDQMKSFKVKPAVKKNPVIYAKFRSKMNYPMKRKPRGRVYVINNHFSNKPHSCLNENVYLEPRQGTDEDEMALNRLFKNDEMMFTVDGPSGTHKHEVTAERMRTLLKAESEQKDHGDCFILCILSHGLKDAVYGADGNYISIEDIVNIFDDKNCPALANKPKLFFFQACRGAEEEKYLKNAVHVHTTEQAQVVLAPPTDIKPLQHHENCFLAFATTSGSVSWRDEKHGSLFIQSVVRIFWEFAHKDEICSLMTKVNHLVNKANYKIKETIDGKEIEFIVKQTSVSRNFLNKGFYFFPGLSE